MQTLRLKTHRFGKKKIKILSITHDLLQSRKFAVSVEKLQFPVKHTFLTHSAADFLFRL